MDPIPEHQTITRSPGNRNLAETRFARFRLKWVIVEHCWRVTSTTWKPRNARCSVTEAAKETEIISTLRSCVKISASLNLRIKYYNFSKGFVHKWRHSIRKEGVKDFMTTVLKKVKMCAKFVQNCVTSFNCNPASKIFLRPLFPLIWSKIKHTCISALYEFYKIKLNEPTV